MEEQPQVNKADYFIDGTPCAVKVACTVWSRGKDGDNIKILPIATVYAENRAEGRKGVQRLRRYSRKAAGAGRAGK